VSGMSKTQSRFDSDFQSSTRSVRWPQKHRGDCDVSVFSVVGSDTPNAPVYARYLVLAHTPPNVVSLFGPNTLPEFDASTGAIQASFSNPASSVTVWARAQPQIENADIPITNQPFLEAYDANNNFLGKVLYPYSYLGSNGQRNLLYGDWAPLTYPLPSAGPGPANIAYVLFSSQNDGGTHVYALFDDLAVVYPNPR
jgi:hypothetical protein